MIKQVLHTLQNPNDVPDVPRALKDYLQSRYNHTYIMESGEYAELRRAGYSEQFIAGVIHGLFLASRTLDEMESRKELQED